MYRDMDSIPVLAPEGAIVPMYRQDRTNDLSLEQPLEIHLWSGNGRYELYEDDGRTTAFEKGVYVVTALDASLKDDVQRFVITPGEDKNHILPERREFYLKFRDIVDADIYVDGNKVDFNKDGICLNVSDREVVIEAKNMVMLKNKPKQESKIDILTRVQAGNNWKASHFKEKMGRIPQYIQGALDELDALL